MPWTFSDSESDASGPPVVLPKLAMPNLPLPKLDIPSDPRWARSVNYHMRRKEFSQSRVLLVETALSGTLPEADVFQATNYNDDYYDKNDYYYYEHDR